MSVLDKFTFELTNPLPHCSFSEPLVSTFQAFINGNAKWDKHFMQEAKWASRKSKDRSTKVGAVVVNDRHVDLVRGWNGFPRGVNDDVEARHARPAKYVWTEHAERNAIYNAASEGIALRGTTLYCTHMPCADCARGIIQAGITRVCTANYETVAAGSLMALSHNDTLDMFEEAGISISIFPETIFDE